MDKNREEAIALVKSDGLNLQNLSPEFQNDPEIVKIALTGNCDEYINTHMLLQDNMICV